MKDLSEDHLLTYRSKIEKVTAADIQEMAIRLGPERAILLIVGNEDVYREIASKFGKVSRIEANF